MVRIFLHIYRMHNIMKKFQYKILTITGPEFDSIQEKLMLIARKLQEMKLSGTYFRDLLAKEFNAFDLRP